MESSESTSSLETADLSSIGEKLDVGPDEDSLRVFDHSKPGEIFHKEGFQNHLDLLHLAKSDKEGEETSLAPIITGRALGLPSKLSSKGIAKIPKVQQFGLLAGLAPAMAAQKEKEQNGCFTANDDPRVFFNVTSPSSTFICGSQGSGKSHTLSCMLENCLISSKAGQLDHPLTGLVFHYDSFISDTVGSPCEAAYLSSNPGVKVRILCSPTNIQTIRVCCL